MAPPSTLTTKIKVQLKLSISRLRMMQQKDEAIAKQQRRAMAQLLEQGKYESARIRTENIIHSDLTNELHETLELYCELLLARVSLLESVPCDPGLEEAVKSIIYAAPRIDAKELAAVRGMLIDKFGKVFASDVMDTRRGVSTRVLDKLRIDPPGKELVESYLEAIAEGYDVDYPPGRREELEARERQRVADEEEAAAAAAAAEEENNADGGDETGTGGGGGGGLTEKPLLATDLDSISTPRPPRNLGGPRSPVSIAPPKPSTDNVHPSVKLPGAPDVKPASKTKKPAASGIANKGKIDGEVPDVNDLEKRFALLKR